jgi:hypothetical protein
MCPLLELGCSCECIGGPGQSNAAASWSSVCEAGGAAAAAAAAAHTMQQLSTAFNVMTCAFLV